MNYSIFHLIHVFSVIILVATVFSALAAAPRKKVLMYSGIASLIVFLSGFGLLGILKAGMPGWSIVKMLVWLLISVLAGLSYRLTHKHKQLYIATLVLVLVALLMVEYKPF